MTGGSDLEQNRTPDCALSQRSMSDDTFMHPPLIHAMRSHQDSHK